MKHYPTHRVFQVLKKYNFLNKFKEKVSLKFVFHVYFKIPRIWAKALANNPCPVLDASSSLN